MAIYTYITEACCKDARLHDMESVFLGWAKKVEKEQTIGSVDRYPRPFLKRNIARRGRLIIEERTVDEDIVYCFLRVLIRGSNDYDSFQKLCHKNEQQRFLDQYAPSKEDVLSYLQKRKEEKPVESLPLLSDTEHIYLSSLSRSPQRQDGIVLESREWVDRISKRVRPELRIRYGDLLQKLILQAEQSENQTLVVSTDDPGFRILYRYFPKQKTWFVIAPLDMETPDEDEIVLRDKYRRVLETNQEAVKDQLLQEGLRSYPALITLDSNLWLNTQESEEANLALSPEEIEVLNSVLSSGDNSSGAYPLFVNGRPGSGKSTVLLYLFAEHLYFHLQQYRQRTHALSYPPLYLTYSESLLNDARRIVGDILLCDSEKALSDVSYLQDPDIEQELDRAFGYFRNFIWSLLPEQYRVRFEPSKYIDFPQFRTFFRERITQFPDAEIRKLTPEIAWHVIRSYIKGMRQDASGHIDLDFYENELPRNQQSVTSETFRAIYEVVWVRVYQKLCEEDGYWDDQDLARCLLDLEQEGQLDLSKYPAIFCDEAQDFTKVELELILHLSRYAKRSVPTYLLHKIPFAFAGDPFQTLNPTGFDWDATRASFHDNVVKQLDKTGQANLEFNFKELAFNYRSTRHIVQFCNLIQLLRGRAFGIRSLQPQKTWQVGLASDPVYFDYTNPACQQALRNEPGLVIIVPCQEGEEESFVRGDDFLCSFAWNESEQTITSNVLSPMRAKGLQFQRVVLYKFGQQALQEHGEVLDQFLNGHADMLNSETSLPLEYFVNGLYVAASRPRQHLMVVDTAEAFRNFWSFAIKPDFEKLIATYNCQFEWRPEDLTRVLRGTNQNWSENRDDPRQLGNDFFSRGRATRDPHLLSLAIQNFDYVGDVGSAAEARALKFIFEGKQNEAGKIYASMDRGEEALSCFWKSESYQDIIELGEKNAQFSHSIRYRAAAFLQGDQDARSTLLFINQVFERITEGDKAHMLSDEQWPKILKTAIEALARLAKNENNSHALDEWKRVYSQIIAIRDEGIRVAASSHLARIAFEAAEYKDAKIISSDADQTLENPLPWLITVLAETEPYPVNVQWLYKLDRFEDVVTTFEANGETPLVVKDQDFVFEAYIKAGDFEGALNFAQKIPVEKRFIRVLNELLLRSRQYLVPKVCEALLVHYVQNGEWSKAIAFASRGDLSGTAATVRARVRDSRLDLTALNATLIRLLARSDGLVHESAMSRLKPIQEYLKEQLLSADDDLRSLVSVKEAGTAIERANRIVDALTFYEAILDGKWGKSQDTIRWARERWVKVKHRQAEVIKRSPKVKQWREEAEARRKVWGVNPVNELPEYPALPLLDAPFIDDTKPSDIAIRPQPKSESIESEQKEEQLPTEEAPVTTPLSTEENVETIPTEPSIQVTEEHESIATEPDTDNSAPVGEDISHMETVASSTSPEAAIPDVKAKDPAKVTVEVSLQVDDLNLRGTLKRRHRILEVENTDTEAKIMIDANQKVVSPLYGLDSVDADTENTTLWYIHDWKLRCLFAPADMGTLVFLEYEPSGEVVFAICV